jgi:hypothetical protein
MGRGTGAERTQLLDQGKTAAFKLVKALPEIAARRAVVRHWC